MCRILCFFLFAALAAPASAQVAAVRLNAAALAAGTLHAGVDFGVARRWSVEASAAGRPFAPCAAFGGSVGVRRWAYEPHAGWFVGAHASTVQYRAASSTVLRRGWAAGVGLSTGYSWVLSARWNLSVEAGVGVFRTAEVRSARSPDPLEPAAFEHARRWVVAPSRFEASVSYLF